MKTFLLATALTALALPALAQTSTSTGEAVSQQSAGIYQQFASSPEHSSVTTVPGLGTQIVTPTVTCSLPITLQGVLLGAGLGGGTAYTVEYCKDEEISRQAYNQGDRGDAQAALCLIPEFRKIRAIRALYNPVVEECPPEFGPNGLSAAINARIAAQAASYQAAVAHIAALKAQQDSACHEQFIPPANPNGAGYMAKVCN
jgi:hypothetical protein